MAVYTAPRSLSETSEIDAKGACVPIRRSLPARSISGVGYPAQSVTIPLLHMLERLSILISVNRLSVEQRVRVLAALVDGNSIRATCRMTGAAKNTVVHLLEDVVAA